MLGPETVLAAHGLIILYDVGKLAFHPAKKFIAPKKHDDFLIYDPKRLTDIYNSETTISDGIPYSEISNLLVDSPQCTDQLDRLVDISVSKKEFAVSPGTGDWGTIQAEAFIALRKSRRILHNEPCIRLYKVSSAGNKIRLAVQRAHYFDQAKSNLVLDWKHPDGQLPTLRTLLMGKYGNKLPDLDDRRLANSVGIACLIFFREDKQWIPYLVRRTKKIGVFPGGLHCAASGVANWPDVRKGKSFSNFFINDMYNEIREEVGLTREDLTDLRPIALCREFSRAGKPQIFFAGVTSLSRKQLRDKRRVASKVLREMDGWKEIEKERWYKSQQVVIPPSRLASTIKKFGITLETQGSLYYGIQYIERFGERFV